MAAWCISPPLATPAIFRVGLVVAVATWAAAEAHRRPSLRTMFSPLSSATYAAGALMALVQISTDGWDDVVQSTQVYILLALAAIGFAYSRRAGFLELRPVFVFSAAMTTVWSAVTLWYLQTDPHVARLVVRSSEEAVELQNKGVGGYALVYFSVIMVPILVHLHLSTPGRYRWPSVGYLLAALMLIAFVVAAGYSIAVLSTVLAITILAVVRAKSWSGAAIVMAVIAPAAMFMFLNTQQIIAGLMAVTDSTQYLKKLSDFSSSLQLESAVGTLDLRYERYARSLDAFLASPLWGSLWFDSTGKHSTILDHFARFGILGGITTIGLLVAWPFAFAIRWRTSTLAMPLAVAAVVAIVPLLNTVTAAHGLAIFLLLPAGIAMARSGGAGDYHDQQR